MISGQDLQPDRYNSQCHGIPYLTGASNIDAGEVIVNRWTDSPTSQAIHGDILLSCKGTVGKLAILNLPTVHIARQIMSIRVNEHIDKKYIRYILDWSIDSFKLSAKSMIPGIERKNVLNLLLPIPPRSEQKRIVQQIKNALKFIESLTM